MPQYLIFRNESTQAVVTASCRGQVAFDWIVVVEAKETTFEELAFCDPMFDSLDMKLLAAVQSRAKDVIRVELNQYYESAKQNCKRDGFASMLRGRQALWLLYQHFRTTQSDGTLFSYRHLQLVLWKGDSVEQLEEFDSEFTRVLGGMENRPREVDIQDHYVRQFRQTKSMREDVAYFDRIEDLTDPDKSWTYLQKCLRRQCNRIRADINDNALCPADAVAKVAAGVGGDANKQPAGGCLMFLKGKCKFGKECKLKHDEAMQKQFLATNAMVAQPEPKPKGQDNKGDKKGRGKGDRKGKEGGKAKEGKGPNAPVRPKQTCFNKVWFNKCDIKDCTRDHSKKAVDAFKQDPGFAAMDKRAQAMLAAGKTAWDPSIKE
jgi:hypothetical protein